MKKLLILFAVFSLTISLAACGGNGNDDPDPVNCDDGFTLVDGECVEDEDPIECDEGYSLVDGECVEDDEPLECEADQEIIDGVCVDVEDLFPVIDGVADLEILIGDTFDPMTGVTATDPEDGDLTASITLSGSVNSNAVGIYNLTYTVIDSYGNETEELRVVTVKGLDGCEVHFELVDGLCVAIPPTEITIMHGAVQELDPFHESYSGTEQLERQELQTAVEEQFNVIINYEPYPPSAAWGPSRITAIIQSSISGEHLSDIYWVTSDWIQQLADADAIAPVTQYMNTHGSNIGDEYYDIGSYQDEQYGFDSYKVTVSTGLYYNADLIDALGVPNPSQIYLDGGWTWSYFEAWSTQVQTALSAQADDMYALGGMLSYYAAGMIPLNGGSLINADSGRVSFAQNPAIETYDFLTTLYEKGLFEPTPAYDAGSPSWQAGKVALHPGSLWFVNASNRWGGLTFELGYVPYPIADDFTGEYSQPVSGIALMTIATGMDPAREELVFQVWNALQTWKTPEEEAQAFELSLLTKFDDELYIDAYLDIYDKVYLDLINAIGISAYGENGWTRNINTAIREGTSRSVVDAIRPIYEDALDEYLGN